MKKISLSIILLFVLEGSLHANKEYSTPFLSKPFLRFDTLLSQLAAIDLLRYQGLSVDSLIAHLPSGYIELKITGGRSPRVAEILNVVYPNKVFVEIHVLDFSFMDPHLVNTPSPMQNWNVTLFRKETISFAVIYNRTICINGCENEDR